MARPFEKDKKQPVEPELIRSNHNGSLSWRWHLAVLAFFCLATLVMTWPLAPVMDFKVRDYGDPLLNTWILWWNVKALTTEGVSLFNAPMFHPSLLTLAYSEHMIITALAAMPLLLMGLKPLLVYNILFMLTFVVSGYGAYLLAHRLTQNRAAAVIAGLGFAFSAFRFGQLGHLQILAAHFMPFVLLYLHKWQHSGSWKHAFLFGLFWLLQVLSCGYHALFISLAVGLFMLYYGLMGRWWQQRRRILQLAVVAAGMSLFIAPLFQPYIEVKKQFGFTRDLGEMVYYSAQPQSYAATSPENLIYGELTKEWGEPEKQSMLGLILTALAVLGLIRARGKAGGLETGAKPWWLEKRDPLFYGLLALMAFWASLGPMYGLYYLFYLVLPGFDNLRVPGRLAILVSLAWGVLAAYGAAWLMQRYQAKPWRRFLPLALAVLVMLEAWHVPVGYANIWQEVPEVYKWLTSQPDEVVIYEIPTFDQEDDVSRDARYLYWSIWHQKRMVNGYSGYFPDYYRQLSKIARRLDFDRLLPKLRELGATHLIWHRKEYPGSKHRPIFKTLNERQDLKLVWESTWDYVYRILPGKQNGGGKAAD
jgi:hypothetical protein